MYFTKEELAQPISEPGAGGGSRGRGRTGAARGQSRRLIAVGSSNRVPGSLTGDSDLSAGAQSAVAGNRRARRNAEYASGARRFSIGG